MLLKSFKVYVVLLIASVVLYACKCKEQGDFLGVYNIYFEWYNDRPDNTDHMHYSGDTLRFDFALVTNCIAQTTTNFSPFISAALATQPQFCPCGENGFRKDITGLKVYTDNAYGNYDAGSEITSLFSFYTSNYDSMNVERRTVYNESQIPGLLSQQSIESHQHRIGTNALHMQLTQKPGDTLMHTFTVHLTTADSTYQATSPPVKWH
ncbi:MAG TPA: hypothetical protein VK154_13075 [Chitinophagales bacterium]|nr:hypothetical protein [Chitinophagales bacterium]